MGYLACLLLGVDDVMNRRQLSRLSSFPQVGHVPLVLLLRLTNGFFLGLVLFDGIFHETFMEGLRLLGNHIHSRLVRRFDGAGGEQIFFLTFFLQ